MSTVIAQNLSVSVQFREQYVSQGLNAKQVAFARGIVRGGYFVPSTNVAGDRVLIKIDPITGDTVINAYGLSTLTGNDPYAVTYRSDVDVEITITANAGRPLHFIYFEGGYSPLTTTNAKIVDYTEAEFEAGTADANGGVLIGVVRANAAAGSLITAANVMTAGMTNTLRMPFKRHFVTDFAGAQGYQPVRERVLSQMNFGYSTGLLLNYIQATAFTDALSKLEFTAVDTPIGNGALRFEPVGADLAAGRAPTFFGDRFLIPSSTTLPRKVRMEIVYRTSDPFAAQANAYTYLAMTKVDDVLSSIVNPMIAPNIDFPALKSTNWSLYVTEFDIPQDGGGAVTFGSVFPTIYLYLSSGWIEIASVTCIGFEECGIPSEVYRADGLAVAPVSYGNLATAPHQNREQTQLNTVGLRVTHPLSTASGWTLRGAASQKDSGSNVNAFYIAPNQDAATSHLYIGAASVTDLKTAVAEDRFSSVTIYGDAQGTAAGYAVKLTNTPLRVDEIRPNAGYGANAKRIDLRDADGNNNDLPPPFISSAGTAGATGVIEYNGGTSSWGIVGAVTNYVNVASVATPATYQPRIVFSQAFADNYYIPMAIFESAASATKDYFVQLENKSTTQVEFILRETGTALAVPSNGDKIYFTCIGRLA
jgi:hypothetical protein